MRIFVYVALLSLLSCNGMTQESRITFLEYFPGYQFRAGELRCYAGSNECEVLSSPNYKVFVNEDLVVCRVGCNIESGIWGDVFAELQATFGEPAERSDSIDYGYHFEIVTWKNLDNGFLLILTRSLNESGPTLVRVDWSDYSSCR